jgi:hypothetical protein
MKKGLLLCIGIYTLILIGSTITYGQITTIANWTYEPLIGANATPTPNSGSGTSLITGSMSGPGGATGMNTGTGCGSQTSGTNAWALSSANPGSTNESSGVQYNVSTAGFENITVRWEQRWSGTATNTIRFQYTTDGSTWNNFTMTSSNTTFCNGSLNAGRFETNTSTNQYRRIFVDLTGVSGVDNNPNFGFRVVAAHYQNTGQFRQVGNASNIATGGTWRFDNVIINGEVMAISDPSVTATSSFTSFFYPFSEGPSAAQTMTISGSNLTNPIVVTPPANYEIATSLVGPYQTTALSFAPVSGSVAATDVYIRVVAGLLGGVYNDDVVITSDAPSSPVSIAVSGVVLSEVLTYFENFGSVSGQFPLGWTTSGAGAANWSISTSSPSAGSGQANLGDAGTVVGQEAILTMNRALSTVGTSNVVVSFSARKTSAYSGNVELDFSTDGISWTNVPFVDVANNSNWGEVSVLLPPSAGNVNNLRLRLRTTRANTSGNYRIDDFTVAAAPPAGPAVNISASTSSASEDDQTQINITVTLEQAMPTDEIIELAVTGTNVNENDYTLSSNSVTILAGQTIGSVTLNILDDNLNEGTETLIVNVSSISPALSTGLSSSVALEIVDNDDAVLLLQVGSANPVIDFNELQNTGTNLYDITRGFYLFEEGINANSVYRASEGNFDTGDTYSYGANASTERALGSLSTGPLSPNTFGARLVNTTGQLINALQVSYVGEQWRVGAGAEDALTFSYSLDATDLSNGTWTEVSALTFNAPVINGAGAALNGNDPANQVNLDFEINNILVLNNGTIWIKWVDENIASTDHGMAVDNLVFTPIYNLNVNAPTNDEPCGALNITNAGQTALNTYGFLTDMSCDNNTGNNSTANLDAIGSACNGVFGRSLWYTFTTPLCDLNGAVPFEIEVSTNNPGTDFNTKVYLFSSPTNSCSNMLQLACNNDNAGVGYPSLCGVGGFTSSTIVMTNLQPNTQYWVKVDGLTIADVGDFVLSGRAVAAPHGVSATGGGTQIQLTTANMGAGLYTYYYKQVGSTGHSTFNSATALTNVRTLAPGNDYITQIMYRCGSNFDQSQFYRTAPQTITLASTCALVSDMTCIYNGPNSYTLTWTQPSGDLFTNNGALSGYRIKRSPVGSTGVYTFSNPAVVCNNGTCSVTLPGNSPTGFNWTIETRCSANTVQVGNTTSCGPAPEMTLGNDASNNTDKSMQHTFSFVNAEAGIEFVDVQMHDAYADFGLNTPMFGDYEMYVNSKNEITWRRVETAVDMNFDFVIVPNPSNAMTTVHLNTVVEAGTFTIVDAMGRTINSGAISNTYKVNIDAAQLQSGVYMVVVTVGNQQLTRRLVVAD